MAQDLSGAFELLLRFGYLIVFISGLAEALPLVGLLVPGQAVIIAAGAAAAAGYFSPVWIILILIPAGVIGDAVTFYLGRRYGRSFIETYGARLRIGPRQLASSDALLAKYGVFALILARFSFLTRSVGPLLAGMSKMRNSTFWIVNVIGAAAWAIAYTLLGYFLGVGFLALQREIGRILAGTIVAVVGLYIFYRVLRKYASQFTRDDLYIAIVGVAAGTTFGIFADNVSEVGAANRIDTHTAALQAFMSPLASFFAGLEIATSFAVLGAISLGVVAYFSLRRRWWDATLIALGVGGIIVIVETLRPVFRSELPPGVGDSFPSATAAIPLVLAGVTTYLVAWRVERARTAYATAIGGALVATVALFARLGHGAEYASSVFAGLALGTAWLSVTVLVVEFRLKRG